MQVSTIIASVCGILSQLLFLLVDPQIGRKNPGKNAFKFTKTHSLVTFIEDEVVTNEKQNRSKVDEKLHTITTEGKIIRCILFYVLILRRNGKLLGIVINKIVEVLICLQSYFFHSLHLILLAEVCFSSFLHVGVLLLDPDVFVSCTDIAFSHSVWRSGSDAAAGFFPRLHR